MGIKKHIPQNVKTFLTQRLRVYRDWRSGDVDRFANVNPNVSSNDYTHKLEIAQPIYGTDGSLNKIDNIRLAKGLIEQVEIKPGQIFSFYHTIGQPLKNNGYKKGRNIIKGELTEDYGGGLCQLAGLIFHLAISSGLEIAERHNHTVDLYAETERYTPLGADATVVFGYKDLRIVNNLDHTIRFSFDVEEDRITGYVNGQKEIIPMKVEFERIGELNGSRVVKTKTTSPDGAVKLDIISEYWKLRS